MIYIFSSKIFYNICIWKICWVKLLFPLYVAAFSRSIVYDLNKFIFQIIKWVYRWLQWKSWRRLSAMLIYLNSTTSVLSQKSSGKIWELFFLWEEGLELWGGSLGCWREAAKEKSYHNDRAININTLSPLELSSFFKTITNFWGCNLIAILSILSFLRS